MTCKSFGTLHIYNNNGRNIYVLKKSSPKGKKKLFNEYKKHRVAIKNFIYFLVVT